jgi:DNA invertase Pin-like site-specific DNA recombinase
MKLGYSRVSTSEQNLDRQFVALREAGCDKIFVDKISGTKSTREGLGELYSHARIGDVVLFDSLDRIGRTLPVIFEILDKLFSKGCEIKILKQGLTYDPSDPFGKLMFQQFAAFAEFERSLTRQRQSDGVKAAKLKGATFGRPSKLSKPQVDAAKAALLEGVALSTLAVNLGVARTTLYRALTT